MYVLNRRYGRTVGKRSVVVYDSGNARLRTFGERTRRHGHGVRVIVPPYVGLQLPYFRLDARDDEGPAFRVEANPANCVFRVVLLLVNERLEVPFGFQVPHFQGFIRAHRQDVLLRVDWKNQKHGRFVPPQLANRPFRKRGPELHGKVVASGEQDLPLVAPRDRVDAFHVAVLGEPSAHGTVPV